MKHTVLLSLLGGSLLAVVALFFVRAYRTVPAAPPVSAPLPALSDPAPALSALPGSETPGKDNVSHAYKMRVARLEQRLDAAPDDTTALAELASLMKNAHQTDRAAALYERYLARHPRNRQAWLDLADCYGDRARWDEARRAMNDLLEQYPADPAALYNLGAIHANLGQFDEARTWWERARGQTRDPDLSKRAATSLAQLAHRAP